MCLFAVDSRRRSKLATHSTARRFRRERISARALPRPERRARGDPRDSRRERKTCVSCSSAGLSPRAIIVLLETRSGVSAITKGELSPSGRTDRAHGDSSLRSLEPRLRSSNRSSIFDSARTPPRPERAQHNTACGARFFLSGMRTRGERRRQRARRCRRSRSITHVASATTSTCQSASVLGPCQKLSESMGEVGASARGALARSVRGERCVVRKFATPIVAGRCVHDRTRQIGRSTARRVSIAYTDTRG